jgi:Bacterial PH domain
VQWSPRPAGTIGRLLLAVTLGALALFVVVDIPGRLLLWIGAGWALLVGLHDVIARPRLAAGPGGVVVRTWLAHRDLPWRDLRIRQRTTSRWGVRRHTLELDDDPPADEEGTLVVLSPRDVGVPLDQVVRALRALDPRGS